MTRPLTRMPNGSVLPGRIAADRDPGLFEDTHRSRAAEGHRLQEDRRGRAGSVDPCMFTESRCGAVVSCYRWDLSGSWPAGQGGGRLWRGPFRVGLILVSAFVARWGVSPDSKEAAGEWYGYRIFGVGQWIS